MYIQHVVSFLALSSHFFSVSIDAFKTSHQVHEVHGFHPQRWQRLGQASSEQRIHLRISLAKEKSDEELDQILQDLADVRSPQYGQYLGKEEMKQHWKPSLQAQEAMENLIKMYQSEADDQQLNASTNTIGDYWNLNMNVALAEEMFSTSLYEYQHQEHEDVKLIRPHTSYSLPNGLHNHIVFIDGLTSFPTEPQARMMRTRAATRLSRHSIYHAEEKETNEDPSVFAKKFSSQMNDRMNPPSIIRQQYEVPENWHLNSTHERNQLVMTSFLNEFYSEKDLSAFMNFFEHSSIQTFPSHTKKCFGSHATGEASLDIQVAMGIAKSDNIDMKCYSGLRDPSRSFADDNQEPFLTFLHDLNAIEIPAAVASISYTDDECAMPPSYAQAVNHELMKASMRGTTVVISAGDAGVQGSHLASNFCGFPSCTRFESLFPASSPYVLSVGATSLNKKKRQGERFEEVVTSTDKGHLVTGGGGFSRLFEAPEYQKELIQPYLEEAQAKQLNSMFDRKGRAYPDIAAVGSNFPVIENGQLIPTDGTSVSAPIIASLIVLINKILIDRQLPTLGFVNPLFYQMAQVCPQVFHDITEGDIACGSSSMFCCEKGHFAMKGWDATSGVGTLKFATFINSYEQCIQAIKATQPLPPLPPLPPSKMVLLATNQVTSNSRGTEFQRRLQDMTFGLSLLAGVVLGSVLFSMRRQLFTTKENQEGDVHVLRRSGGERSYSHRHRHRHTGRHEPALEYLLAAEH